MEIDMVLVQCADCGTPFAISRDKYERLRECHNNFFCPNGHANHYNGETEAEKLRKQLKQKEESLAYFRRMEDERLEKAKKELEKKQAKKKAKKKAATKK